LPLRVRYKGWEQELISFKNLVRVDLQPDHIDLQFLHTDLHLDHILVHNDLKLSQARRHALRVLLVHRGRIVAEFEMVMFIEALRSFGVYLFTCAKVFA
jgi:hypothetical protein